MVQISCFAGQAWNIYDFGQKKERRNTNLFKSNWPKMQNRRKMEKGPNPPSWAQPRPSQEEADQRRGPAEPAQARARPRRARAKPGAAWSPLPRVGCVGPAVRRCAGVFGKFDRNRLNSTYIMMGTPPSIFIQLESNNHPIIIQYVV